MAPKSYLLLLIGWAVGMSFPSIHLKAEAFSCQTLNGETLTINRWPIFIITSRSEKDLSESLQCASLVGSLETRNWLIDFAWPQREIAKRLAANTLLRSDFMKKHATVLKNAIPDLPLISLVDSQHKIIWSSPAFPSDEDWSGAKEIFKNGQNL